MAESADVQAPLRGAGVRFLIGTISIAALTALATLGLWAVAYPAARGWSPMAVTSGSMTPAINVGDVLVAAPASPERLVPGAVIVFDNPAGAGFVTHRVVELTETGEMITQGDANAAPDSTPVMVEHVRGVGRLVVPVVGRPHSWMANGQWLELTLALMVFSIAVWTARWGFLDDMDSWAAAPVPVRRWSARPPRPRRFPALPVVLVCFAIMFSTASRATLVQPSQSGSNSITAALAFP